MPLTAAELTLVCLGGFLASIFGVIVGGHSFITVPLMIFGGMEPAYAVATNRFATLFLSVSGLRNYERHKKLDLRFSLPLALAAAAGSSVGALFLLQVDPAIVRRVISVMMLALLVLGAAQRNLGLEEKQPRRGRKWMLLGLSTSFGLGLYWGFFGGGGTTLFVFFLVSMYGMSFLRSVANSNLIGFLASVVAVAVFVVKGAIYYEPGFFLGVAMGAGAYVGSLLSIKAGSRWVRRIFFAATLLFAVKLLI